MDVVLLLLVLLLGFVRCSGMEPLSALTADDAFHHVACQQELAGLQQLASQNQLAIGRPFLDLPKETLRSYLKVSYCQPLLLVLLLVPVLLLLLRLLLVACPAVNCEGD